jgi:hypothetical protein
LADREQHYLCEVASDAAPCHDAVFLFLEARRAHSEEHVEALTTLFSVITDIESMDFPTLLGHKSYDTSGDGMVDWNELEAIPLPVHRARHLHRYAGSKNDNFHPGGQKGPLGRPTLSYRSNYIMT